MLKLVTAVPKGVLRFLNMSLKKVNWMLNVWC
jgi:hypothetical protein